MIEFKYNARYSQYEGSVQWNQEECDISLYFDSVEVFGGHSIQVCTDPSFSEFEIGIAG